MLRLTSISFMITVLIYLSAGNPPYDEYDYRDMMRNDDSIFRNYEDMPGSESRISPRVEAAIKNGGPNNSHKDEKQYRAPLSSPKSSVKRLVPFKIQTNHTTNMGSSNSSSNFSEINMFHTEEVMEAEESSITEISTLSNDTRAPAGPTNTSCQFAVAPKSGKQGQCGGPLNQFLEEVFETLKKILTADEGYAYAYP